MILILIFLLWVAVWAFFKYAPHGVNRRKLLLCNIAVLATAIVAASVASMWLYEPSADPVKQGFRIYLVIMAWGTAFLGLVALGGFIRNFLIFPPASRASGSAQEADHGS
jgi:hypothetical protein